MSPKPMNIRPAYRSFFPLILIEILLLACFSSLVTDDCARVAPARAATEAPTEIPPRLPAGKPAYQGKPFLVMQRIMPFRNKPVATSRRQCEGNKAAVDAVSRVPRPHALFVCGLHFK